MRQRQLEAWIARPTDFDAATMRGLEGLLDETERRRAARFRHEADRKSYVLAHALRRRVLGRWLAVDAREIVLSQQDGARPVLLAPRDDALYFSHSHSRAAVACAVTRVAPVGIDAEAIHGEADDGVLERFVVPDPGAKTKAAALDAPGSRFHFRWTALEAFWKARGTGLADGNPRLEYRGTEVWLEGDSSGPHARLVPLQSAGDVCITLALCSTEEVPVQLFNANMHLFNEAPAHEMLSTR